MKEKATFIPALALGRTPAEKGDQSLSWQRSDEAFFASGACHILAFAFRDRNPDKPYRIVAIRPRDGLPGNHVFVTDGRWAFDFNGWTRESVFLAENMAECRKRHPNWECDLIEVTGTLAEFCDKWPVRAPEQFAFDPMARTHAYLDRFPSSPPS